MSYQLIKEIIGMSEPPYDESREYYPVHCITFKGREDVYISNKVILEILNHYRPLPVEKNTIEEDWKDWYIKGFKDGFHEATDRNSTGN